MQTAAIEGGSDVRALRGEWEPLLRRWAIAFAVQRGLDSIDDGGYLQPGVWDIDDGANRPLVEGRSAHQAPEVDGSTLLVVGGLDLADLRVGSLVSAEVVGSDGVDLAAVARRLVR